ncbi:MAG: hypothetical protein FWE62_02255, partial [Firmicutes bacterium]|nr:hypothetical protein [Bacillota bacterium]
VVWNCTLAADSYVVSFTKSERNPTSTSDARNPVRAEYGGHYYTFDGWYTDAAFTGTGYATIAAAPNGMLYAKWI